MRENIKHGIGDFETNGTTGEICKVSGVYRCVRIKHGEIMISKSEPFPYCPHGEHTTVWVLGMEVIEREKEGKKKGWE